MGTLYDTSIVVFLVIALICTDSTNPHWSTVMGWASGVITCIALTLLGIIVYAGWATSAGMENVWTTYFFQYVSEICYLQTLTLWLVVPVAWLCQRNNVISCHWKRRKVYFMGTSSLLVLRKVLLVVTFGVLFSSQLFIADAVAYFMSIALPTDHLTAFTQHSPVTPLVPAHLFMTLTSGVGYMYVTKKMLRC